MRLNDTEPWSKLSAAMEEVASIEREIIEKTHLQSRGTLYNWKTGTSDPQSASQKKIINEILISHGYKPPYEIE